MKPDVSAIIPAYNRFKDLTYAVESILAQTLPVSEVIVIDDGSVDETPEMIPKIIAENPAWRQRVRYFYQENRGQSAAGNYALTKAKGEWVAYLAHDDLWLPRKLEWQFRALEKFNGQCGLCFTDAWFMNNHRMKMTLFQLAGACYENEIGIVEDLPRFIEHQGQAWVQTVVVRADLVRQIGGTDEKLHYAEDIDFIFRLAQITKFCYVNLPMVLIDRTPAQQRHVGRSLEWHKEEFRLQMLQYHCEKNLDQGTGLDPGVKKLLRMRLRQAHSSWANLYLRRGDYDKARESVSKAAAYDLTPSIALKWTLTRIAPWVIRRALLAREQIESRQIGLDTMK
jgi:glycosyltransferase involved in cell wall biosynthesis